MEASDLSGQILNDRYQVLGLIGEGAMGSVYRAERLGLGRIVAVKVMNERMRDEVGSRRRFEREAAAMAKLEHPHCASVLDIGVHNSRPYVVMDFVSGTNLTKLIDEGPVPIARAVEITRQVLSGLAHAHELGIVHRDIKPANIVLSQKAGLGDHVKILDFGLARLSEETSNLTAGVILGTPSYMAPEQIRGILIDGRADLYACGVMLFELLTGTKPFQAANNDPLGICMMHINVPAPRLADKLPGHDFGALEEVIARALEKDRERRFATADEFATVMSQAIGRASYQTPAAGVTNQSSATPASAVMKQVKDVSAFASAATSALTVEAVATAATSALTVEALAPLGSPPPASPPSPSSPSPGPPLGSPPLASPPLASPPLASPPLGSPPLASPPLASPPLASPPLASPPSPSPPLASPPAPSQPAPTQPALSETAPAPRRRGVAIGGGVLATILVVVAVIAGTRGGASSGSATSPVSSPAAAIDAAVAVAPESPADDDPVADLIARAQAKAAGGRHKQAVDLLLKARRAYPQDARVPYHAGRLYLERMYFADGLPLVRAAIALDPAYRSDDALIKLLVRGFNATASYDGTIARFLRNDIGEAAKPYLEDTANNHRNPIVRKRAAAELRRY